MLIAFSGLKGSGKDTAAEVLITEYGFTKISFADPIREALLTLNPAVWTDPDESTELVRLKDVVDQFGWDKSKRNYTEVRRLMQVFGTEVGRMLFGEDVWIDFLAKRYKDLARSHTRYVITDCRFTNEARFVKDKFGMIIWVQRPDVKSDGHASETDEVKQYADYTMTNDETVAELQEDVRFMAFMRGFEPIEPGTTRPAD